MRSSLLPHCLSCSSVAAPAGAAVSTNHSGWLWGNPEPQGNNLSRARAPGHDRLRGRRLRDAAADERRRQHAGAPSAQARRSASGCRHDRRRLRRCRVRCAARRTDDGGDDLPPAPVHLERAPLRALAARPCRSRPRMSGYLLLDGRRRPADHRRRPQLLAARPFRAERPHHRADVQERERGSRHDAGGDIFRTDERRQHVDARVRRRRRAATAFCSRTCRAVAVGAGGTFLVVAGRRRHLDASGSRARCTHAAGVDFIDVQCVSATVCLVRPRCSGGIFRTTDGGVSFTDTACQPDRRRLRFSHARGRRGLAAAQTRSPMTVARASPSWAAGSASGADACARHPRTSRMRSACTARSCAHGRRRRDVDQHRCPDRRRLGDVWFPTAVGYALDVRGGVVPHGERRR